MKKLEKLTLKSLNKELPTLSTYDQEKLRGGNDLYTAQDVWNYIWEEVEDEFTPITNFFDTTFETIEEAGNDFTDWIEDNNVLEIAGAIGAAAADIYLWWLNGVPSTGGMPIYSGSDPGSYSS